MKRLQVVVRRGSWVAVLARLLLLPLHVEALGAGDLDTRFGGDGKVLTSFGSGIDSVASALALQPNGKIVVAGFSSEASGSYDFALARYLPNGALDSSFGGDGKVTTDFGNSIDQAYTLAIQPRDGRLVVARLCHQHPYQRKD